jgi:hypothetical protein
MILRCQMKRRLLPCLAVMMSASALAACASGPAAPETDPAPLTVYLLGHGRCEVRSWELACADVPTYAYDVLRVRRGTLINLELQGTHSEDETAALAELLGQAGFRSGSASDRESEK